MGRGRVKVTVDLRALRALRDNAAEVLRDLDLPCRDEARRTLDVSAFLVPVGDPNDESNLATTAFLEGPIYNPGQPLSTTWLAGYNHHAAGAIHEGFHWGERARPPPHWMKRAFKGAAGRARRGVAATLSRTLRRFFPAQ